MFSSGYIMYYVLAGILSLIGFLVSNRLKSKFKHYGQIGLQNGMTGKEVAEAMLRHYNIHDVKVVATKGMLTDHYNPLTKTVALSEPVYGSRSISAAAVAAHECGHAVQHDTAYSMLKMRSILVPVVNYASMAQQWLLMLALGAFGFGGGPTLLFITIIAFAITTLFSFITLPVEFDASNRALAWLDENRILTEVEHEGAKDALWWAAMTYVSAALSALVILLFLVLRYASSD
jgi:Zn-dependent membrane protease YugP